MTDLIRWNPYTDFERLERTFDRFWSPNLLAENLFDLTDWQTPGKWPLELDLIENDDAFVVKASVPGLKPENLDVTLINDVLSIKGEIGEDKTIEEGNYTMRERHYGRFARSIHLPQPVDPKHVEAVMENGVLTIKLNKIEGKQSQSKHIEIQHKKKGLVDKIKKVIPIL